MGHKETTSKGTPFSPGLKEPDLVSEVNGGRYLPAFTLREIEFKTLTPSLESRFQPVSLRACYPGCSCLHSKNRKPTVTPVLRLQSSGRAHKLKYISPSCPWTTEMGFQWLPPMGWGGQDSNPQFTWTSRYLGSSTGPDQA